MFSLAVWIRQSIIRRPALTHHDVNIRTLSEANTYLTYRMSSHDCTREGPDALIAVILSPLSLRHLYVVSTETPAIFVGIAKFDSAVVVAAHNNVLCRILTFASCFVHERQKVPNVIPSKFLDTHALYNPLCHLIPSPFDCAGEWAETWSSWLSREPPFNHCCWTVVLTLNHLCRTWRMVSYGDPHIIQLK